MGYKRILVIDDNISTLKVIKAILEEEGYFIYTASNSKEALDIIESEKINVILLDLKLQDIDGLELYQQIRKINPKVTVIIMTAYGTIESAVNAMKLGIEDYLQKPLNYDELKIMLSRIFEKISLKEELEILQGKLFGENVFQNMIGKSRKMKEIFKKIENIARVDSTVLITGESGTGKEMVAKAIHNLSDRRNNKMISINLAAIPEGLQESELFGYEKGAFTGAYSKKLGKFEIADNGTLFLDEIGNINHSVQAKLLRVLEDKKIEPLGSNKSKIVNVRIISATNSNLLEEVEKGRFREDLYYRLNVITINLPPLRERKADIPLLADYFLKEFCIKNNIEQKVLSDAVIEKLLQYKWPGNIRELKNVIEEAAVISNSNIIVPDDLNLYIKEFNSGQLNKENFEFDETMSLSEIEKIIIKNALIKTKGNQTQAAKLLKISRKILLNKIKKYKLSENVPIRTKKKKMS